MGKSASYVCDYQIHSMPVLPLSLGKKKENYLIFSVTFFLISKWRLNKVNPQ